MMTAQQREQVASDIGQYVNDPLGFVLYAFPWGEGELEGENGPWDWQREELKKLAEHLQNEDTRCTPYQLGISSGHDIGKSTFIAWIVCWALSTFGDCRGTITANTGTQLDTKTQPEIAKWMRMAINSQEFDINVTSIKSRERAQTWRIDLVPWSESNPAASAGLHNRRRRLLIIFDEASEIPEIIFETAEGVTLDEYTEIIWIAFGNPTRNNGAFYDRIFGKKRHRWNHKVIDSRTVEGTNKKKLKEWEDDYGEDSDFFRVRARGLPPRSNSGQYIDSELITGAQKRQAWSVSTEPLVAGVDFAWGGSDDNVIRFRKGLDARTIPPIKIKGEFTRDPAVMIGKLSDVLNRSYNGEKVDMLFFDSAGIAAPVEAALKRLGHGNRITVVNFGADSPRPEKRCAYFRDYMWCLMKEWLRTGAIDQDPDLEADLGKPILVHDKLQRVKLESKELMAKRLKQLGMDSTSPDDGDALALTFAFPVDKKQLGNEPDEDDYGPTTAWT